MLIHPSLHRHFSRVLRYSRSSDYAYGAALAALPPSLMLWWERVSPSQVGKGGFAPIMRLAGAVGLTGGFLLMYQRSLCTTSQYPPDQPP